ncbi:hypothetical protein BGZ76_007550 [Entomortierella beljakovae]|nr:hypothetical protein BGZ76_007550 [Entomortierella beljakovae]
MSEPPCPGVTVDGKTIIYANTAGARISTSTAGHFCVIRFIDKTASTCTATFSTTCAVFVTKLNTVVTTPTVNPPAPTTNPQPPGGGGAISVLPPILPSGTASSGQNPSLPAPFPVATDVPTLDSPTNTSSSSSLSTDAIIGISVGSAVLVILIGVLIFILLRRKNPKRSRDGYQVQTGKSDPDMEVKFLGSNYHQKQDIEEQLSGGEEEKNQVKRTMGAYHTPPDQNRLFYPQDNNNGNNGNGNNNNNSNNNNSNNNIVNNSNVINPYQGRSSSPAPSASFPSRADSGLTQTSSINSGSPLYQPGSASPLASNAQYQNQFPRAAVAAGVPGAGGNNSNAAKIEYTPRSTYIPSPTAQNASIGRSLDPKNTHSSSTTTTTTTPPPPPPPHVQDSQTLDTDGYIDLIPVEETPRIPNATVSRDGDADKAYSQVNRSMAVGGGMNVKRGSAQGSHSADNNNNNGSKQELLEEDDDEVNEDEIQYL